MTTTIHANGFAYELRPISTGFELVNTMTDEAEDPAVLKYLKLDEPLDDETRLLLHDMGFVIK